MTTDPNTHVDLLDKDGNIIGSGTTGDTGHVTITPTKPIPEGNVTAKATDNAEHPNSSTSQPKSTDTTPTAPVVTSDLTGKATTTDPVEVTTDPNTKVELLDKDGNVIGSVRLIVMVMSRLHRQDLFLWVMSLRKLMTMRKFLMLRLLNRRKQLIRHLRTTPTLDTDLGGKAGTQTPITVTTDPNTHVDLLDKDGNIIGSGTTDSNGHVTITPTKPIPEGNVSAKATDNAEHPNSSTSQPKSD